MHVMIYDDRDGKIFVGTESADGRGCESIYEGESTQHHELRAWKIAQTYGAAHSLPVYVQYGNRPKILVQDFPLRTGQYLTIGLN